MSYVGHWLAIKSFKHDGTLHRTWDRGLVLENNDSYVVIATKRAKVIETNGRSWFTKEPAVTIFSKDEWWNVICMLKEDGICYYCNIASPSLIDNGYIKYIDYDLDAKLFSDNEIRILDEKEYNRNKRIYSYSANLDKVLKTTINEVVNKMKARVFPFDDEIIKEYFDIFLKEVQK